MYTIEGIGIDRFSIGILTPQCENLFTRMRVRIPILNALTL